MVSSRDWTKLAAGVIVAFLVAGCGMGGAKQIKYPERAITFVVPFAPGGASDLTARPVSDLMKGILGQPMVVVNKPGGGGSIGAAEVAKSKNDGYTLLNGSNGPVTIIPYTTKVAYDYTSLEAVAQLTDIPLAVAVSKNSPLKTLKDFVEYAKANPGKIRCGLPAVTCSQHIGMEGLMQSVGGKITYVPYEGANPAVAALLGGHIDATATGVPEVAGQYMSGEVRILGVATEKRMEWFPDVPTFREQGYDLINGAWYGVFAPAGTPKEIIGVLAEGFKKACADAKVLDSWKKLYLTPSFLGPTEFSEKVKRDADEAQKVLKGIGLSGK